MRKIKVLITGGAGYIGSVLVPKLLETGIYKIAVIDNFMYQEPSLVNVSDNPDLTILNSDIRDYKLVNFIAPKSDYILPLACLTGAPICDRYPNQAREVIVDALKNMISSLKPNQRLIYPTTNSGYGIGSDDIYCDENSPLNPISHYGRLKVEAEKMILERKGIALRLATVFGVSPRMRLDLLVNDMTFEAVKKGHIKLYEPHFKRNFIHVRDIADAFVFCLNNFEKMQGQVYNVGLSEANISKMDLCLMIKERVPKLEITTDDSKKDPDQRNYIVNNEKIEALGFKAKVSLKTGIQELIKYYEMLDYSQRQRFSNI